MRTLALKLTLGFLLVGIIGAVLVAVLKLGDLVAVSPGPGAVAFTLMVLLSLLAALSFDPHALYDDPPHRWHRTERPA